MLIKDRMPKLRPREVDVPIYPNGAHSFGASCYTTICHRLSPSLLPLTRTLEDSFRDL